MNIIIPIGGKGERFLKNGYKEPKPLIPVLGKQMIFYVLDNLNISDKDSVFIIYYNNDTLKNAVSEKYPNISFIEIDFQTKGATETIYEGLKQIKTQNKKTMLFDCDTFYTQDVIATYRNIDNNAVFYVINKEETPIFSYIEFDENNHINKIAEKVKISDNANTGIYCFNDIKKLFDYSKFVVENNITFNGECYTSCIIDKMIQDENIFESIQLDPTKVFNLGTPKQLENYIDNTYIFLFDLDGTLVLSEHIYFEVWKEILKEYNIVLTQDIFNQTISGNTDDCVIKKLLPVYQYNCEKISKKKDDLFIEKIEQIILIEGVENTLKYIKENGNKIALVTNCNRRVSEKIIEYLKLSQYFEFIVVGNECDMPKPYPDPYKRAIELFDSRSNKAIIFEDSKTGLLSAYSVSPRCIIGIETNYSSDELIQHFANITIYNFSNFTPFCISNNNTFYSNNSINVIHNYYETNIIKKCIKNSINIDIINIINIEIGNIKLKGGFISDVIDIKLYTNSEIVNCVGKMENKKENFLTQMSHNLDLYNREYYFYKYLSEKVPLETPKCYGIIKDENDKNIGLLLENINRHKLNLNLNEENMNVSLKIIENISKMHSMFWDKNQNLKKNNESDFDTNSFIKSKIGIFKEKWKNVLTDEQLNIANYICENFVDIENKLSNNNLTLCHGDVKSANIFYKENGDSYDPIFIDWQYIVFGKGVQDLVFFMIESFDIEKMNIYKKIFKEYYYSKLIENGVINYSKEDYEEDFINASYYFPFFVAIWFGTLNEDELIDKNFPNEFIKKLFKFYIQD
jgi:beta-phosphoglucomutase-like phosphatase (HAD superfamily)/molybdopterin-guanine dinucleotide biosynthesis protein A